jgi:hypothetical protein
MKKMLTKTLLASAVAVVCAFSANVASAQSTVFADFTVDPLGPAANFVADKITGNYVELANFTPTSANGGTFTANLYWKASAFVANDGTNSLNASTTGLGNNYGLYALYTANGTFSRTGERTDFNFTQATGNLSLWLDTNNNTTYVPTSGLDFTATNTGDDVRIAAGRPLSGNGFIDPSNPQCAGGNGIFCGAFGSTTTFQLENGPGTSFFVAPSPFYQLSFQSGQLNNFNPVGRQQINGSLDVTFNNVPEPTSIALLGLGLVGLGLSRRRKQA